MKLNAQIMQPNSPPQVVEKIGPVEVSILSCLPPLSELGRQLLLLPWPMHLCVRCRRCPHTWHPTPGISP